MLRYVTITRHEAMGNIADTTNFSGQNRRHWKDGLIDLLRNLNGTHALTLSWNRQVPLDVAWSDLKSLHGRVDAHLLNTRRFDRKPRSERSLAVFTFEKIDTHLHCHSIWKVRDQKKLIPFARLFPGQRGGIWNEVVSSGSYELGIIDDQFDWAGYMVKDQHPNSDDREVVWSDEFLPTS